MGFRRGGVGAPCLSQKRIRLLGKRTDLNAIIWAMATYRAHIVSTDNSTPDEDMSTHMRGTIHASLPGTRAHNTLSNLGHVSRPTPMDVEIHLRKLAGMYVWIRH